MILLSLITKTLALALAALHPWLAAGLWLAGGAADYWLCRAIPSPRSRLTRVLTLHLACLVIGWATAVAADYAAMRWKDGVPVLAALVDGLLGLTGMQAAHAAGDVHLTTMAGALRFAVSFDGMAAKVPLLCLVLAVVWLLWTETALREVLRRTGILAAVLLATTVVRTACVILLANGLFEFVGYESEELPYRPFMDEAFGVWSHLPFLLAAGGLLVRWLPRPLASATPPAPLPRRAWLAVPAVFLLACAAFWKPQGTIKNGKVVISTYHSQWSRCDRPYDREWYGADSGYNYACVKRLFEAFHPVSLANGPLTAADLTGAGVLVIYDPDRRFSQDEIELVRGFVRGGGGLLVVGDHTNVFGSASHLNELCEPFGFQFRDDVLFDLDEDFHQVIDAPPLASSFWHGMSFFKLRGPASIRPTSFWTRCVYQVMHAKSVRAIYSVNNFYPPPHDSPQMKQGRFCVAAAAHYGSGRVAAWGDSTVFSNFEIFYPGKYEYLLNTLHWLNHKDALLPAVARRMAALVLLGATVAWLVRRRDPRNWLATTTVATACLLGAAGATRWIDHQRAGFPQPVQPTEWVHFLASTKDPAHHLKGFVTEEPYDQRYQVFIQWVLRTGSFAGYHLTDAARGNALAQHLRGSDSTRTALAAIVRKPDDLVQLEELAAAPKRPTDPVLLMFASTISAQQAAERLKQTGLVQSPQSLAQLAQAWPAAEVMIQDGKRNVLVVAGAERFSDQSMGISEKVDPDDALRATFNRSFALIDRLFGRDIPTTP